MGEDCTMPTDTTLALRLTDRKRLLTLLGRLGDTDPELRAKAALEAAELVRRKGVSWGALVPPARSDVADNAPEGWPAPAVALLGNPALTEAERAFLRKASSWRTPGASGMAQLQAIAARVGAAVRTLSDDPQTTRVRGQAKSVASN